MKKTINAGLKSKVSTVSTEAKTVSIIPVETSVEIVENVVPERATACRNGRNGQSETPQNGATATTVSTVSTFRQGLTEVLSKLVESPDPDKETIRRLTQMLIDAGEVKSKTDVVQKVWLMTEEYRAKSILNNLSEKEVD